MKSAADIAAVDANPSEWKGSFCPEAAGSARVAATAAQWEKLWKDSLGKQAPEADFEKHFAVAVFLGTRNTGGYAVEFLTPRSDGKEVLIAYRVRKPGQGMFVIQAFTQPYHVKLFKKTSLTVRTVEEP